MRVKLLVVVISLALTLVSSPSILVASVSAAKNLNSSKSNIYRVTGNSLEPVQAKINQLKEDPAVKSIKINCIVKTNPFEIICTITWERTQSGGGLGTEATTTTKGNSSDETVNQNKSK